jgi:hypothetical protein
VTLRGHNLGAASDGTTNSVSVTLTTVPDSVLDVVYVAYVSHRSVTRAASSVSGLGASAWASVANNANRFSLWRATGASASGVVTLLQSQAGPASLMVFVLRGLTVTTAVLGTGGGGTPVTVTPGVNAQDGKFVVAHWGSIGAGAVTSAAISGTPSPATGWNLTTPAFASTTPGAHGGIYRSPTEGVSTAHSASVDIQPAGTSRAMTTYLIG